jgi:hypothetical protein
MCNTCVASVPVNGSDIIFVDSTFRPILWGFFLRIIGPFRVFVAPLFPLPKITKIPYPARRQSRRTSRNVPLVVNLDVRTSAFPVAVNRDPSFRLKRRFPLTKLDQISEPTKPSNRGSDAFERLVRHDRGS